jgi:hypothetical protein
MSAARSGGKRSRRIVGIRVVAMILGQKIVV